MTGLCRANAKIALGNSWGVAGRARGTSRFGPVNHSASLRSINRRDGEEKGGFEGRKLTWVVTYSPP